jgi:hypothetical protein
VGSRNGYELEIFYSDLGTFFDKSGDMDAKLFSYDGDFMPYIEPMGWSTDFWTGYYTSRPHLKALISVVFTEI